MNEGLVLCRVCKVAKPVSEMVRDRSKVKGYAPQCYPCNRLRQTAYRKSHSQQVRERDGAKVGTQKVRAREALKHAVQAGRISKPSACQDCGRSDLQIHGHHHDYSKPLDVAWVCRWCHNKRHQLPDAEEGGPVMASILGQYLHDGRMQLGLTLREIADKVELSTSYISDIERGNRVPTMPTALALGRALKQGDGEIAYFWVSSHLDPDVLAALTETMRTLP